MAGEEINIQFAIIPASEDVGKKMDLILVVNSGDDYYMLNGDEWVTWNRDFSELQVFGITDALPEVLNVSFDFVFASGEYGFFIGYRNGDRTIVYNQEPLSILVQ